MWLHTCNAPPLQNRRSAWMRGYFQLRERKGSLWSTGTTTITSPWCVTICFTVRSIRRAISVIQFFRKSMQKHNILSRNSLVLWIKSKWRMMKVNHTTWSASGHNGRGRPLWEQRQSSTRVVLAGYFVSRGRRTSDSSKSHFCSNFQKFINEVCSNIKFLKISLSET